MKYFITILLVGMSLCRMHGQSAKDTLSHELYPKYLVGDTVNGPSSGPTYVPVRYCLNNTADSQIVYIVDLPGLKYNEFKHLSFKKFNDSIVSRIISKKCLDLIPNKWSQSVKISHEEFSNLKPDSLLKKYFVSEKSPNPLWPDYFTYGEFGNYKLLPREVLVAFVILMDNSYILSMGCHEVYSINKALSDQFIRKLIANKRRID